MRMRMFIVAIMLLTCASAEAAFNDSGWGTRPAGMGGAFVALSDDANAPLWNPAGITQVEKSEATFMYAMLYSGLDKVDMGMNYVGFVTSLGEVNAYGINWASFKADDQYNEDTYSITYARAMSSRLSLGLNIKYLNHSYDLSGLVQKDDPTFKSGDSKSAVTGDIGLLAIVSKQLSFGLAAKNITQPDVGLKSEDKVPMEIRAGLAYTAGRIILLNTLKVEPITLVDVKSRDGETTFHLGIEGWFGENRTFAVRGGYNPQEITAGISFNHSISESLGIKIDYALILPSEIEDSSGSHRVSMGVKF